MRTSCSSIAGLLDHLETVGRRRTARTAIARWTSSDNRLSGYETPDELAAHVRSTRYTERDGLLEALLRAGQSDELAQLTAVAAIADRLRCVVAGWRRRGARQSELVLMEADLVAECWSAAARLSVRLTSGADCPAHVGQWLVDEAREPVRVPRRKELRAAARRATLDELRGAVIDVDPRTAADRLAIELGTAVREGRISLAAVRPVFLTRVAGFDVTEAARRLGCSPAVLRAIRSRSERQLAA